MKARINYLHFGAAAALAFLAAHGAGTRTVSAIGTSTEAANSREALTDASGEATLSAS